MQACMKTTVTEFLQKTLLDYDDNVLRGDNRKLKDDNKKISVTEIHTFYMLQHTHTHEKFLWIFN